MICFTVPGYLVPDHWYFCDMRILTKQLKETSDIRIHMYLITKWFKIWIQWLIEKAHTSVNYISKVLCTHMYICTTTYDPRWGSSTEPLWLVHQRPHNSAPDPQRGSHSLIHRARATYTFAHVHVCTTLYTSSTRRVNAHFLFIFLHL